MSATLQGAIAAGLLLGPAQAPPIQRPETVAPAPSETAEPEAPTPDVAEPEAPAPDVAAEPAEPEGASTEPAVAEEGAPTDVAAEPEAPEDVTGDASGEVLHVATERAGPPYYTEADLTELRKRHGVEPGSPPAPAPVRWRCLIADPSCRHTFELQAMGAYARRVEQGAVDDGSINRWSSARAQYDFWASLPVLTESEGKNRYTRMSLGPKGGVSFSDTGDLWGNLGIAARYWLGHGRWAPSIEITSALSFMLGSKDQPGDLNDPDQFQMKRSPVGFQADVGFGLGGFGSIVFGGQYDSPLAREDIPEEQRVYAGGMFYVGFRGNILWGGPAAAAVAAHASTRAVTRP